MKAETLTLEAGTVYFRNRSEDELADARWSDAKTGNTLDSAGEPKLYCRTVYHVLREDTLVTITKRRGVEWDTWRQKPGRLTEGLATIDGRPQIIMFSRSAKFQKKVVR